MCRRCSPAGIDGASLSGRPGVGGHRWHIDVEEARWGRMAGAGCGAERISRIGQNGSRGGSSGTVLAAGREISRAESGGPVDCGAMRIWRGGQDSERGPSEQVTGTVWLDRIATPSEESPVAVFSVHFAPGAHTAWHAHPRGQVLHVTEGAGLVQRRGGPVEQIRAGDTVRAEAGEWHWHGAGPGTFMTHLAVQEAVDGATAEWGEHPLGDYPA